MSASGERGSSKQRRTARLGRLDCCAVSDAMDRLGLNGTVTGIVRLATERRVAGAVVTVRLERAGAPAAPGQPQQAAIRHLGTTAIEACEPGDVVVVEQRSGIVAGSWGGILSVAASVRGVAGVISDGLVRDIDEACQLGFAVYARGSTALTARGRLVETGTQVPVRMGDVAVQPGDYVIADGSGVVFVPGADIDRVLEAAEQIAAREAAMAKDLLAGKPATEVMGRPYENMLRQEAP